MKKKQALIFVLILIGLGLWIKGLIEENNLKRDHRYTIGEFTKLKGLRGGVYALEYFYFVNGVEYENSFITYEYNESEIGNRYFIIFEPGRPKNVKLLIDKPVPDDVLEAPPNWWKEIPN